MGRHRKQRTLIWRMVLVLSRGVTWATCGSSGSPRMWVRDVGVLRIVPLVRRLTRYPVVRRRVYGRISGVVLVGRVSVGYRNSFVVDVFVLVTRRWTSILIPRVRISLMVCRCRLGITRWVVTRSGCRNVLILTSFRLVSALGKLKIFSLFLVSVSIRMTRRVSRIV